MSATYIPTVTNDSQHAALARRHVPEVWGRTPEELWAGVVWDDILRARGNDLTSGVLFARKMEAAGLTLTEKDEARRRVLYGFDRLKKRGRWKLKVLTMPGLTWKFERMLLDHWREGGVRLSCVERDPAIFFGSVNYMPGAEECITQLSPHCISTAQIERYYFTTAEAFLTDPYCPEFDAVWLDFNGQMTIAVMRALKKFWRARAVRQLVVTSFNGRFRPDANAQVVRHGGVAGWMADWLGAEVVDEHRYSDGGANMIQVTVER